MRIIYVPVGGYPEEREIDGSLESMQKLVGGYIETVPHEKVPMCLYILNEEGKIMGLPPNRLIYHGTDVICGNFFLAGMGENDEGEADIVSLTQDQIDELAEFMKTARPIR